MTRLWAHCTTRESATISPEDIDDLFGVDGVADAIAQVSLAKNTGRGSLKLAGGERLLWLKANRENGRKGGRPKKKPKNQGVSDAENQVVSENRKGSENTPAPAPAPAPAQGDDPATQVIAELNRLAGTSYRPSAESNRELVLARLSEGYSLDEVLAVVRDRVSRWKGDEKMAEYLRPGTLFRKSKFADYVGQAKSGGGRQQQLPPPLPLERRR
jgi:uncharacterized phage protein (TIGR02220 family)